MGSRDELLKKTVVVTLMLLAASYPFCRVNIYPSFVFAFEYSGTDVGGAIATNTTWTLSGSPYRVTADVLVLVGVFLNIEPGVAVSFENGTSIVIDGTFAAQGGSSLRILFTSNLPSPASGDWGSIRTRTGGRIMSVAWATIEYSAGGMEFPADSFSIVSDSVFRKNKVGISGSNVNVTRCTFENNENGAIATNVLVADSGFFNNTNGIVGSGACDMRNTNVWNNSGNGVQITGTVTNCSIYNNGELGGSATSIADCSIYGNNGHGATADTVTNCSVHDNAEYGILGSAFDCLVFNNGGGGISGAAINCSVFKNGGNGVVGSGVNSTVHDNGGAGVVGYGNVINCQVYNNNGTGTSGNQILVSDIFNNTGFGAVLSGSDAVLSNCDIHDNLAGGILVQSAYWARGTGSPIGTIENSTIHDNLFGILMSAQGYGNSAGACFRELRVSGCTITHNAENGIFTDETVPSITDIFQHAPLALTVRNTVIDSNGRFGISLNTSDETTGDILYYPILEVNNCTITNHIVGIMGNLGIVTGCNIMNNSQTGLDLIKLNSDDEVRWTSARTDAIISIHWNNINDNGLYNIRNHLPVGQDLNATMNWWGTTNTSEIGAFIYDYYEDYNLSRVLFEPILTSPIPEFPSFLILPLFMIATFLVPIFYIFYKRKHST